MMSFSLCFPSCDWHKSANVCIAQAILFPEPCLCQPGFPLVFPGINTWTYSWIGERLLLPRDFRGLVSWLHWSMVRQGCMVRGCGRGELSTPWQPESREDRKGPRRDTFGVTCFSSETLLSLSPTNNAIKLIIYQWINPLMKAKSSWSNHLS